MKSILQQIKNIFRQEAPPPKTKKTRYEREQENIAQILDNQYTSFKSFKELKEDARKRNRKPWAFYLTFIPASQAYINVRSYLEWTTGDYKAWKSIRDQCEANAGGCCEICQETITSTDPKKPRAKTECHEVWEFENGKQKLVALIAVCKRCHDIFHLDANSKDENYFNKLLKDYEYFNNITYAQAKRYYYKTLKRRENIDNEQFLLDLSFIKGPEQFDPHSEEFKKFLATYKEKD